jgi:hypothetical protein
VKLYRVITCWQGVISGAVTRLGFSISWSLSNPTPQQQWSFLPNVKTYTEGGKGVTFEELPCFNFGFNLGFHIHLGTLFQRQK